LRCLRVRGEANRSELVHFDANGKLLERYTAPGSGPHDLNDLVLRGTGEIYLSDTFAHQAYRFNRASHNFTALSFPRPIFYPNGIIVSGDGNLLYVADLLGVICVDLRMMR
jgi:sugar lactone lactonase YvrE